MLDQHEKLLSLMNNQNVKGSAPTVLRRGWTCAPATLPEDDGKGCSHRGGNEAEFTEI